jgi:spoIIIJ-associated protein
VVPSHLIEKQETHVSEQLTDGDAVESTDATDTTPDTAPAATTDTASGGAAEAESGEGSEGSGHARPSKVERLEHEGDIAADYLEELLDIADLDGDLDMDVEGDRASVQIGGADLSLLVGRNGEVLEALQELTRLAVYRETGERSRLMLDVGGHRAQQRTRLVALAETSIAEVKESGQPVSLEPMSAFERKVVHDAVAAAGLTSESEGAEPKRHVVILPA